MAPHRPSRLADFFESYTKDLTADDLQRLFTRDARDAYKFFTRHRDADAMQRLPWHRRAIAEVRILFLAFSMKLSPARRVVFGGALLLALIGLFNLFRGVGIIEVMRVPLIGGKVERLIGTHLAELVSREQQFTTEWIANNAGRRA